jgi:hypothetical protein
MVMRKSTSKVVPLLTWPSTENVFAIDPPFWISTTWFAAAL